MFRNAEPLLVNCSTIPDDLLDAVDYYNGISIALSNRFRENVDQRLSDIASNPEMFPFDFPPVRFAKIDRFPYLILSLRIPKSSGSSLLFMGHRILKNGARGDDCRHPTRHGRKAESPAGSCNERRRNTIDRCSTLLAPFTAVT